LNYGDDRSVGTMVQIGSEFKCVGRVGSEVTLEQFQHRFDAGEGHGLVCGVVAGGRELEGGSGDGSAGCGDESAEFGATERLCA